MKNDESGGGGGGGACLFVCHLPWSMGESALADLFSVYGTVTSTRIVRDMHTLRTRYAFVNMAIPQQAIAAVTGLNGYQLENKFLKVSFKSPN